MSRELYDNLVHDAIRNFNEHEQYLIRNDLSERCICARFSIYLMDSLKVSQFNDYEVDVEYNRGVEGKEYGPKIIDAHPITVDLIVHKRGIYNFDNQMNLICMEMKKSSDRRGCDADEARLRKMCSHRYNFCYQAGYMILVNMRECRLEVKRSFLLHDEME